MSTTSWIKPIAKAGLIAKGVVYLLLGALAFMAAFEIGGQTDDKANKQGVFEAVRNEGGKLLLGVLVLGLLCYSIWRIVQAVSNTNSAQSIKIIKRLRYMLSGLVYLSVAFFAAQLLFDDNTSSGNSSNSRLAEMLSKPWGAWVVGLGAFIIAGIGIYQIHYGFSGKYQKHISSLNLHTDASRLLSKSGKVGYIARGVVWLILSWLLFKAALHSNSKEAGDTGKAFQFLENTSYGSYLLGALGLGLACYGIFYFIRSRYETNL